MPVAAAIGVAGVVGAGASVYGANQQAKSAKNALNMQESMFDQTQANLKPYISTGNAVANPLLSLLGLGPQGAAGMKTTLENMPGFQFAESQGLNATQNAASASGRSWSGPQALALQNTAEGIASQNYGTLFNNLLGVYNTGAGAAGAAGNLGAQFSGQMSGAQYGIGNAQASGAVGAANALTGAAGQYAQYNVLQQMMQSGAPGAGSAAPSGYLDSTLGFGGTGYG